MSKHRRPTRLQRLGSLATNSPLQLGIAAGVAGTLTVSGTVVASAADSSTAGERRPTQRTGSTVVDPGDISYRTTELAQTLAVTEAARDRAEAIAKAKARREAARKRAAEKRAAERARAARTLSSVSRSVERMSASASHALQIAAAVASDAYYAYGGQGPNGFDCSGFTSYVFSKMGISLPHSSSAQRSVARSVSSPQPGDLVFVYNGGGGSIGHVAIYAGGGYWWEASNPSMGVGKHRAWSTHVSYGRVL